MSVQETDFCRDKEHSIIKWARKSQIPVSLLKRTFIGSRQIRSTFHFMPKRERVYFSKSLLNLNEIEKPWISDLYTIKGQNVGHTGSMRNNPKSCIVTRHCGLSTRPPTNKTITRVVALLIVRQKEKVLWQKLEVYLAATKDYLFAWCMQRPPNKHT